MANWISSKLKVAETFLQQIDQQAAESLKKNENPRFDDPTTSQNPKKIPTTLLPPLKDQLKNKKIKETTQLDNLGLSSDARNLSSSHGRIIGNRENKGVVGVGPSVSQSNAKPSSKLSDGDWTELLGVPSQPTSPAVNRGNGLVRIGSLRKDGRKKGSSGSSIVALENKRNSKSDLTKQDSFSGVNVNDQIVGKEINPSVELGSDVNFSEGRESSEKETSPSSVVDNQNEGRESGGDKLDLSSNDFQMISVHQHTDKEQPITTVPITANEGSEINGFNVRKASFSAIKVQSPSVSDDGLSSNTDSSSSSDSESEREREERRMKRAQILAERAAAKAAEAIKERENLVARLEGEKQSLEKILEERAKQQMQEASELQNTMMETMDAVELEKQKHNSTRMEALTRLSKLETTNADLARSLAAAQWNLEVEISRVGEIRQLIETKEASHEEFRRKISATHESGNQMVASRGVEIEHEILESEYDFIKEKIRRLQEKEKTLNMNIEMTRKEAEVPTEVEIELKQRLGQLTDHLIQKQAQVESLSSEKAMLAFRIETVSRLLDENKSMLNGADMASISGRDGDDIEAGVWEFRNSKLRPMFEQRIQSGRRHFGSLVRQLDSIFCAGAVYLRRNSTARMWSLVYLVCLHLWVMYILFSHSSLVPDNSKSGAVFSLENINNTGGV